MTGKTIPLWPNVGQGVKTEQENISFVSFVSILQQHKAENNISNKILSIELEEIVFMI